ncbi:MAG: glycosyltransferase [Pseudonocardiales bacterium]
MTFRRPPSDPNGVVVFAGLDWWYHNRAHADFQLAQRIAASRRVLLVNSIGTRMPRPGRTSSIGRRLRAKLAGIARGVRRPVAGLDGFYVYSPLVLPAYGSAAGRRIATALVRLQVSVVRWWLRIPQPAVLVTLPTAWNVVARMRRRTLVFNRSDKQSAFSEVDAPTIRGYEEALLRSADTVLYVSAALQAEDAPLVGERALFLDHGVDTGLFHPAVPPAPELAALPRPRIGYFGALRDHTVDAELLVQIATAFPEAAIVLVGPNMMDLSAVDALPNVHLLGAQPYERVPSFGACFDVAIMPWLDNDWIRNCNPIKLKEYLALGLPVVTTEFPEAARWPVRTARDPAQFVAEIRAALADPGDPDARRATVLGQSWDSRAAVLSEALR